MTSFFRLSRATTHTVVRTITLKTSNSPVLAPHKAKLVDTLVGSGGGSGSGSMHPSRFLENSNFDAKYDKKYILLGLGSSVFLELCVEAMFFDKVPQKIYEGTLDAVKGSDYMRLRLGRHIVRKGNKFGLWVNELKNGKTITIAHYYVQGELGTAKVVFQVEQQAHSGQRLILLIAEFLNADKYVIFELDETPQMPSM